MYEGTSASPDGIGEGRAAAESAGSKHCVYSLGLYAFVQKERMACRWLGEISCAVLLGVAAVYEYV